MFRPAPRVIAAAALLIGAACGKSEDECSVESAGVKLRLADPDPTTGGRLPDFLAHPWPSDGRYKPDGKLRLDGFPNPTESSTLEDYLKVITANTRGYARNGAIYLGFDGALDPATLPQAPLDAMGEGASVFLIDIDERSPERGVRRPLWAWFRKKGSMYLPENHLIVMPPFGISLREGTTYAVIVTDAAKDVNGAPIAAPAALSHALRGTCAESTPASITKLFAPLKKFLDQNGGADHVAAATVFTTQSDVPEMRAIAEVARAQPVPPITDLEKVDEREKVILLKGKITLPGFQSGTIPYQTPEDGGAIRWEDGKPIVDHREEVRIGISIPKRPQPANGYPVVLYSHGTGGDYTSAFDPEVANVLGGRGIAVVSYDQVLHGPRDPTHANVELTFFNLFNVVAGRDNVRQGAADCVAMTALIRSGITFSGDVTGLAEEVRFDRDKVGFLGHSQGGLVGAPFMAVEPAIKTAVFSGTSGVLSITLRERKDPVDFAGLIKTLLKWPDEEVVEEINPVLNLIQTFIEPADPISYSPSYLADPPGGANRDILFVEGFKDFASPARGHEALATAARAPLVAPLYRLPEGAELIGPAGLEAPVSENAMTPAGKVTIGLIQYPDQTHFPIFNDIDANARFAEFMRSGLLDGRARIIRSAYEQ